MALAVVWMNADTGEVKERAMSGVERCGGVWAEGTERAGEHIDTDEEWEATSLDLALALVPDLVDAIDFARQHETSLNVRIARELKTGV